MTRSGGNGGAGLAALLAAATAVTAYLPAAFAYERVMTWLRPMGHAEEAMGRGIEVMLFGGPVGAVLLAAVMGWLVWRSASPVVIRAALVLIVACALASLVLARGAALL